MLSVDTAAAVADVAAVLCCRGSRCGLRVGGEEGGLMQAAVLHAALESGGDSWKESRVCVCVCRTASILCT